MDESMVMKPKNELIISREDGNRIQIYESRVTGHIWFVISNEYEEISLDLNDREIEQVIAHLQGIVG